jgi:hypothetical protein
LNIEASLQAAMLVGFSTGRWKDLLGEYDDYLAYVPTSEGTEMDLVLIRHTNDRLPLWFLLLELKRDRYIWENLRQLLAYETWMTSSQAGGNPRMVHMVACAYRFDKDVMDFCVSGNRWAKSPSTFCAMNFRQAPSIPWT